jgi:hypothetical protein
VEVSLRSSSKELSSSPPDSEVTFGEEFVDSDPLSCRKTKPENAAKEIIAAQKSVLENNRTVKPKEMKNASLTSYTFFAVCSFLLELLPKPMLGCSESSGS